MADYVLIDMAVIAFANAMRVQSIIGDTSLIVESELFGQPTLRARWKQQSGGRPEDIRGLAVEEHVARLRETLLPLAESTACLVMRSIGSDGSGRCRRSRLSVRSL
jgi:hypothetical protein